MLLLLLISIVTPYCSVESQFIVVVSSSESACVISYSTVDCFRVSCGALGVCVLGRRAVDVDVVNVDVAVSLGIPLADGEELLTHPIELDVLPFLLPDVFVVDSDRRILLELGECPSRRAVETAPALACGDASSASTSAFSRPLSAAVASLSSSPSPYKACIETFLATIENERFLCVRGRLSPELHRLDDLQNVSPKPRHCSRFSPVQADPLEEFGQEKRQLLRTQPCARLLHATFLLLKLLEASPFQSLPGLAYSTKKLTIARLGGLIVVW